MGELTQGKSRKVTNDSALGLSGEVGLTPAWGLGSAREKLRMRMKLIGQTTGEPRQGFRRTAARTQTPNPDSGSNWGCAFNLSFLTVRCLQVLGSLEDSWLG